MLTGVGQGLFMSPNTRALMNAAPASEQGASSGLLATGRVLGQCLSVALAGAIFAGAGGAAAGRTLIEAKTNYGGIEGGIHAVQLTFLTGFRSALLVCAGIAAVGIFAALIRGPERKTVARTPSTSATINGHGDEVDSGLTAPPEGNVPAPINRSTDRTNTPTSKSILITVAPSPDANAATAAAELAAFRQITSLNPVPSESVAHH
jgi:hypothetical protein